MIIIVLNYNNNKSRAACRDSGSLDSLQRDPPLVETCGDSPPPGVRVSRGKNPQVERSGGVPSAMGPLSPPQKKRGNSRPGWKRIIS